MHLAFL